MTARRAQRRVVWVGDVASPELAVPCPTCGVTIGQRCEAGTWQLPHRERAVRAEVFGFRAVPEAGPLFTGPRLP